MEAVEHAGTARFWGNNPNPPQSGRRFFRSGGLALPCGADTLCKEQDYGRQRLSSAFRSFTTSVTHDDIGEIMQPILMNEHPLAKDGEGRLKCRIGTVFARDRVIITLPGIHATQRLAYLDQIDEDQQRAGEPPMTEKERQDYWEAAVDLVMDSNTILIRPDPDRMDLAFLADEVLQEITSKWQIRFLNVFDPKVREAIKRRGELWRISRLPHSVTEMEYMIHDSRIGIGGREIYYYNRATGTRYLTCQEFAQLHSMDDVRLRQHLIEIQDHSGCKNRMGNLEIDFFQAESDFREVLLQQDFRGCSREQLRILHEELGELFREAVTAPFRFDNVANVDWRCRMYASLLPPHEYVVSQEELLGLSSEFYMQVRWLPGARIDRGELIFDSLFHQPPAPHDSCMRCDHVARSLILNLLREYGDIEYVNVGCVSDSLSERPPLEGRRGVYLIEMKLQNSSEELLKIVRIQKWSVGERLDRGHDLLRALVETEDYVEYILDRRLACRQLGMNLATRVTSRRMSEIYHGRQQTLHGTPIWTPYYEREYIHGMATDKIPMARFEDPTFAGRFANLLGKAAAPNLVVGRCTDEGQVTFDDGDEILVVDQQGLPTDIIVADFTGAFADYLSDLPSLAARHVEPVLRRGEYVNEDGAFAEAYLQALVAEYRRIRWEYRRRRNAFDTLFRNKPIDMGGNLAYRWERVLERLDKTDPQEIEQAVREGLAAGKDSRLSASST